MHTLARNFRMGQFTAHGFHNTVTGPTFQQDHEFFAEVYAAHEKAYDDVIEYMIGIGEECNPFQLTQEAAELAAGFDNRKSAMDMYSALAAVEKTIRDSIEAVLEADEEADISMSDSPEVDDGIENMLQQFYQDSRKRSYMIQQHLR